MTASSKFVAQDARWDADPDSMPSGMFTVGNSRRMPTTGNFVVFSVAGRTADDSGSAAQIAIANDGTTSLRYFPGPGGGWSVWAPLGGVPPAAGILFNDAIYSVAVKTDPLLQTYAEALDSDPPTTVQAVIDVLLYYTAAVNSAHAVQLGYLQYSAASVQNLNHLENPQGISLTGYSIHLNTDGTGPNAHNIVLPCGRELLQRVELTFSFNHVGESVVLKHGLCTAAGVDIASIIVAANGIDKALLLEWVGSLKKWRLVDYSALAGITIV